MVVVEVVERAKRGDQDAFGELVEHYQEAVYATAYAILGNFEDAQDVAQDSFVRAWREMPSLSEADKFPAWLHRIARNRCLDVLRRAKTRPQREGRPIEEMEDALPRASSDTPVTAAERAELRDAVLAAIAGLSEANRLATTLFYINGYSVDEVAEFLGAPTGTVKRRLHDSRKQLRERMMDMVGDTLKSKPLPDDFARQTVEKAVKEARGLMSQYKCREAEQVLRAALKQSPDFPDALRELNRALFWGRGYEYGCWLPLSEIIENGRRILESSSDEAPKRGEDAASTERVFHETAKTLLYKPDMPEASAFIEEWMEKRGENLARLGMLAWARACMGLYEEAEAVWNRFAELSKTVSFDEVKRYTCAVVMILVDCLAHAGEKERAGRIVSKGWEISRGEVGAPLDLERHYCLADLRVWPWPALFKRAGLGEYPAIARESLEIANRPENPHRPTPRVNILARVYLDDDAESIVSDWAREVASTATEAEWEELERGDRSTGRHVDSLLVQAFRDAGRIQELMDVADKRDRAIPDSPEKRWWDCFLIPAVDYMLAGKPEAACARREQELKAMGLEHELGMSYRETLAIIRGEPTPREFMQEVEEKGPDRVYDGWYLVAREAAAAGDAEKALDALRRACQIWCNPPLYHLNMWEKDTRWGALREHPEFRRIFAERRKEIGPIHGSLWFFPGW